ncbi:uncharacterized protein LOC119083053 [Bradysia coprophila]|uniref:uncharacterized protein LOC119083053 n=1 Tax=Bradysia coprophila TaxID=38358 RepID=UPI00187D9429|nr:uncharacterized protein LOC119083053 [Bradysia coprophila]
MALVNGHYEFSLGGHDILIINTIANHLNATANYKLMMRVYHEGHLNQTMETEKHENNPEQKYFNVGQIIRYDWEMVNDKDAAWYIYTHPGFEINSEKVNFDIHLPLLKRKMYTFLYPHDTDNFILIVPRRVKSKTDYSNILESPLIFVWGPVNVVATIARLIFNKVGQTEKKLTDIYIQTFGLSLGMSFSGTVLTAAEKMFLWWFCLGTMLSGMLLSSEMLQGFALQRDVPLINNLKELELSGMEIHLPNYIDSVTYFFADIPLNLKLVNTVEFVVTEMIASQNFSNAYVIREGKFDILFKDTDDWHVLERFGVEYLSYKLLFGWGMEHRMNELVQRCVDHGITKYLIAENKRILGGSRVENLEKRGGIPVPTNVKPVSFSDVRDTFEMYAIGMTLSSIGFIVEKIVFWKHLQQ